MEVMKACEDWHDGEGGSVVIHFQGWEVICPEEVLGDEEELARITAVLKRVSEAAME